MENTRSRLCGPSRERMIAMIGGVIGNKGKNIESSFMKKSYVYIYGTFINFQFIANSNSHVQDMGVGKCTNKFLISLMNFHLSVFTNQVEIL